MVEEERQRALRAEVAVELVEHRAHVAHGARGIVGQCVHEDGYSVWAVSLVSHLLVVALVLSHSVLDSPFDVVLGHILALGVGDDCTQCRVHVGIRSSGLYCNGYLLSDFGECLGHVAPSFQLGSFAIFKCSSHSCYFVIWLLPCC